MVLACVEPGHIAKMNTSDALIIFARLPRPGEVKTRLGHSLGMERAAVTYREFAGHAFGLGNDFVGQGVGVYLFYDPLGEESAIRKWVSHPFKFFKQQGENLGYRMQHAFSTTFCDGCVRSMIIGTDVPELDSGTITDAFHALRSCDIVLGPSSDGGYYLLGMNDPTKDVFDDIAWSTHTVFADTIARIKQLGLAYHALPVLADIDTEDDYKELLIRRTTAASNKVRS